MDLSAVRRRITPDVFVKLLKHSMVGLPLICNDRQACMVTKVRTGSLTAKTLPLRFDIPYLHRITIFNC